MGLVGLGVFLMAPHPVVVAVREWCERNHLSVSDVSAMVAAEYGLADASAARKLSDAERTGRLNDEWVDRITTCLGLQVELEGSDDPMRPGLDAYCPCCRQIQPSRGDGTCLWCDAQTGGNTIPSGEDLLRGKRKESRSRNAGVPYLCTEEVVLEVRRLYLTGLSMRAACDEVWEQTQYTSVTSMAMTMYDLFLWRGWKRRSQAQATADRNYRHGQSRNPAYRQRLRRKNGEVRGVMCKAVKKHAPGAGQPCRMAAMADSDYCWAHDPSHAEERAAHWELVRERFEAARDQRRVTA